jgi:hypothetical protein
MKASKVESVDYFVYNGDAEELRQWLRSLDLDPWAYFSFGEGGHLPMLRGERYLESGEVIIRHIREAESLKMGLVWLISEFTLMSQERFFTQYGQEVPEENYMHSM